MNASLVFDGSGDPIIPESMGVPNADQFRGTSLEKLGETASRICYQSYGCYPDGKPRGRSSAKLHEHILDVINLSVYEHCNFTVRFDTRDDRTAYGIFRSVANRKGIHVELTDSSIEVTVNFRAVLEWLRHSSPTNDDDYATTLWKVLYVYANELAPQIFNQYPGLRSTSGVRFTWLLGIASLKTEGLTADQAWITLYLYGSRGFTHEQVRHRFAMSQRSTRYVDEDGSPYITHPLVAKFLHQGPWIKRQIARGLIGLSTWADRTTYRYLVRVLEAFNRGNGLDKQTARKQARGASRGYLGNALASEMLFSAPVSGWQWILKQRASKFADAEIRTIYEPALAALKSSQYGHFFDDFNLVPSPDGMGCVLA